MLRSLLGRSAYMYNVEVLERRGSGGGSATYPSPPFEYRIFRGTKNDWTEGDLEYLRVCGCWGPEELPKRTDSPADKIFMTFGSGAEADAHVKRLRYGFPHRWPLWIALGAGAIGIAQIIAEFAC